MEMDRSQPEDESKQEIIEASDEGVRNHLAKLYTAGESGMVGFIVGNEVEIWKITENKAKMVIKIRDMNKTSFDKWELTRSFNFEF